ncbi:MAG: ABC transporter ATP-binding protein [Hyphomicrobium sp.]
MLRVEHLRVGDLPPLTFKVAEGECLAVEGPSGSGKTRLLRAIADLDPAQGLVFLDGAERNEMPASAWRHQVRYCAAEPSWWTDTAQAAFDEAEKPDTRRIQRLLGALGLASELLNRPLAVVSTGERQRLALARALIDEPKVLLLDEPTAALDTQATALVEELIKYQLLSGRIVILASHNRAQVKRLSHARLLLPKRPGAGTTAEYAA